MNRYHEIPGAGWNLNDVIDHVYAMKRTGSTTEETSRRVGVSVALRRANEGLPSDNTTDISDTTHPFLWTPSLTRIPYRVPEAGLSATRTAIETTSGVRIHDVRALARTTPAFLFDKLGGPTLNNLTKVHEVARLARIPGVNAEIALALWEAGMHTPTAVRDGAQATIKTALETLGLPEAIAELRPWFRIQQAARRHARIVPRGRAPRFVGALSERVLGPEVEFWREQRNSDHRSAGEQESADAISKLYQIQTAMARGNAKWARGDGARAYTHYRSVWALLGAMAIDLGLAAANSAEAEGPSLDMVSKVCGALLRRLQPADIAVARRRLGLPSGRSGEGLLGLTHADLDAGAVSDLATGLGAVTLHELSRVTRRRAVGHLADLKMATLTTAGTPYPDNITAGSDVRVGDLRATHKETLFENVGAATIGDYAANFAGAWAALREDLELSELPSSVHTALTGDAAAHVDSATTTRLGDLLDRMSAFDRYYAWRPSRRITGPFVRVSLRIGDFLSMYRENVLMFMRDERLQDVWHFDREDCADPGRFCFLLTAIVARPLWRALAGTLNPTNQMRVSQAMLLGSERELAAVDAATAATTTMVMVVSEGEVSTDPPMEFAGFEENLERVIREADRNYQRSRLSAAANGYKQVLDDAEAAISLEITQSATYVGAIHEALVSAIVTATDDDIRPDVSLADFVVKDDATDLVRAPFPGLVRDRPPEVDITDRYQARLPSATKVTLYTEPPLLEGGLEGETLIRDTFGSTFDQGLDMDEYIDENDQGEELIGARMPPGEIPPWPQVPAPIACGPLPVDLVPVDVDRVEILILHAATQLAKLNAGLNWLGFDSDTVSPWRFDELLRQARYYAEKADGLQQRGMGLMQQAESKTLEEMKAEDAVALGEQGVELALAQEAMAQSQLDAAQAARKAAATGVESSNLATAGAAVTGAAALPSSAYSVAAAAAMVSVMGAAVPVIGVGVALVGITASVLATRSRNAEAKAQLAVAEKQVEVAQQQVAVSVEQTALAQMQAADSKAYLAFLQNAAFTSTAYYELVNVVGGYSQSYLHMGNRLAWMAERAFQFETRRYSTYIRQAYGGEESLEDRFQSGARLLSDLDALVHERVTATTERFQVLKTTFSLVLDQPAAFLQLVQTGTTTIRIDPKVLDLRFPGLYLHSLKRLEVEFDGLLPAGGVHAVLHILNNSFVRVPNDRGYVPKANKVQADWAYPEEEFPILNPNDAEFPPAVFVQKPVLGLGLRQIVSEYRRDRDGAVLAPPEGALDVFENLSTDLTLVLTVPREGNDFDLRGLSDVRLVLYFTAHYSQVLATRQTEQLATETTEQGRLFLASAHSAASFATFRAAPLAPRRYDVRYLEFVVPPEAVSTNAQERVVRNFQLAMVGLTGASLELRVAGSPVPRLPPVRTTQVSADLPEAGLAEHIPDGMVFTARGEPSIEDEEDVTIYASREGTYPGLETVVGAAETNEADVTGTWMVKVVPSAANADFRSRDDDGAVVAETVNQLGITNGAAHSTQGEWLHGWTRVLVQFGEPSGGTPTVVTLRQRLVDDGSVGTHSVTARITWSTALGFEAARAEILDGATVVADTTAVTFASGTTGMFGAPVEVALRVYGTVAELYVDRVGLLSATVADAGADGTVGVTATGAKSLFKQVVHDRLRFDGTTLETVLDEPFEDLDDWSVTSAALESDTRYTLDLSFLEDVLLQLDFVATWA